MYKVIFILFYFIKNLYFIILFSGKSRSVAKIKYIKTIERDNLLVVNEKEIFSVSEFDHKNNVVLCIAICPVLVIYNKNLIK